MTTLRSTLKRYLRRSARQSIYVLTAILCMAMGARAQHIVETDFNTT